MGLFGIGKILTVDLGESQPRMINYVSFYGNKTSELEYLYSNLDCDIIFVENLLSYQFPF